MEKNQSSALRDKEMEELKLKNLQLEAEIKNLRYLLTLRGKEISKREAELSALKKNMVELDPNQSFRKIKQKE
jgi:hypothetical protein